MLRRRRGEQGSAQQAELIRYLHRQRDSLSQEVLRLHVLLERCAMCWKDRCVRRSCSAMHSHGHGRMP